ncbi:MAG TPA: hypothetical protein VFD91_03155 [Mariniphaga sp.]|nr:hypothetical protein [Mariniphaga sp.]
MNINEILQHTQARLVAGNLNSDKNLEKAFSSDLMSDVLTLDEDNILLITGLANLQLIRTAEMADIQAVLLARGKPASPEMIKLADENGIILMETPFSIYKASGILYLNGLTEVF